MKIKSKLAAFALIAMTAVSILRADQSEGHQPGESISYRIHFQGGNVTEISQVMVYWEPVGPPSNRPGYSREFERNATQVGDPGSYGVTTSIPENLATGDYRVQLHAILKGGGEFLYNDQDLPLLRVRNHKDIVKPNVTIEEVPQHSTSDK